MTDHRDDQNLLHVRAARVDFGPLKAVRDVSFSLRPGHLLGLIGPNGAGKTTLLRSLVGLQPLTSGSVHVMNLPVGGKNRDYLREVGFTPDTPAVYEAMTVRQFLLFVAQGYGLRGDNIEERIGFWLEKVWLTEKANQKIKTLSRGMRERLGIARTLLANPAVILLDEPAAGLDPAGRVQFRELLNALREQGKALIVSSHILADMSEYCTHIGIMSAGKMVQFGTVHAISHSAHADGRCRYTILLSRPLEQAAETFAALEGVEDLQVDRERITLRFSADRQDAANLLRELIRRDLPIAAFSANPAGLEEAYLRTGIRQVD